MNQLILIYITLTVFFFTITIEDFDSVDLSIRYFYESTEMNILGVFICWSLMMIFLWVFDPLFMIAKVLYWLFHVGRN